MSRSWNHTLTPYTADEIAALPNWLHCSWPRCKGPVTHRSTYNYVTGRAGRVSDSQRELCDTHAQKFARTHGLSTGKEVA